MVVDLELLRLTVYRTFADTGRPPDVVSLTRQGTWEADQIRDALRRLAASRHLVLDGAGRILMAHPFSAIPLGFAVMGLRTLWWGGCVWDSFALPQLLRDEDEVLVSTRCPACRRPHAWNVGRTAPPIGDQVAHFLVPAERMWNDVVHTCAHQRVYCSPDCVDRWLAGTGHDRGYVLGLDTVWRLAEHWYDGRLDHGYVRREPAAAARYFRDIGLSGSFWGL